MPFTLSHPAAAIPFIKCKLPLSALVVGSMAPDFPYFLQLSTYNQYGHTFAGLFLFCIPAGLVFLGLLQWVLALPLLSLLPVSHRARLIPVWENQRVTSLRAFFFVVLGLGVGAVTHIVWDSFTHGNGWGVRHIPLLQTSVLQTSHGITPLYKFMQHGSTLLGAGLLMIWYGKWYRQAPVHNTELPDAFSPGAKGRMIAVIVRASAFLSGAYTFAVNPSVLRDNTFPYFVQHFVVTGMAMGCVGFLLFSVVWHYRMNRK